MDYHRAVTMWNADPRQQWDFVFLEKRGYPLPVNSGVLDTSDFDVDTTRETLAKNDPKCRREFETKAGHEPAKMSRFCFKSLRLLRNYLWRCQTLWFISWTPNRSWIWLIYGGYLWFWSSLEVQKLAIPLFWCSSNLKSNVTWRTPERRLSLSVQTTFFGPKRVYILGRFWSKFHG